ncbi:uncharacterized protein DUF490 [Lutibacter sp. Hel_I_33_5]|uniref:translocation/assembly module TamB domain-containing protein n=1 Tax=Lutibacter sp. Hel_I_33_5 TaxID=1566289 RepID=UPI0011A77F0A|nr:translocation/assembly module TamB [Lutibacter sp. Hel_I_33_5]TVZ55268.1 uncharacterized protein DUF490 [Lutibacter sp. Hel_I_33_5]
MLFLLLISLLSSLPLVQTKLAKYATERLNNDFGTNLVIKKVDFSFLGKVTLKGLEIRDHHKDTLIFVDKLNTSILNAKNILDNKVDLGSISIEGLDFVMKTYEGEQNDNLSVFIDSFEDDKPKDSISTPFILKTSNIYIDKLNFVFKDGNKKDSIQFEAKNGGGTLQDFKVEGPNVFTKIRGLYFVDNRGLKVTNLTSDFTYTKTSMDFNNTTLQTPNSKLAADIHFSYKREDLQHFNDKVVLTANFKKSSFSVKDIRKLYNEIGGNDVLNFTGKIKGTLNNFSANNVRMYSKNGMQIIGDLAFVNALNNERGFIFDGNLKKVSANYNQLVNVLPSLLGKALPTEFKRFGNFNLSGITKITPDYLEATLDVDSKIGNIISDLQLTNIDDIDNAAYSGEVEFNNFDIGVFFNDPLFGKVSLKGDVNGSGFKVENINTSFIGDVYQLDFNDYSYKNIKANGQYQNNLFDGDLSIDDENLKMNFKGLADLSSSIHKFDFDADIKHADLKKTHLFNRDSIAVLKGNIVLDADGNTLDDIVGKAIFKNISYTNLKKEYLFKEFRVSSSIKDSVKTIDVDSKDIVKGYLKGKFTFDELQPVAQNALGSIYTNYNPYPVQPHQFLDFNFTVYNQIVDVFFPKISVDNNTKIKGKIKADKNQLKLTLSSPKIVAYSNKIENLVLRTDNQNKLYNTHLTADKINTDYYKVSKLNLINRTENDTLYFKSIFKGTEKIRENYNLDFFYTINPEGKSVIGFEKSSFDYKHNTWQINPTKKYKNKVTFDLKNNEFDFSDFQLVSNQQKINFTGKLKGDNQKELTADLSNVALESFLPEIDSLALKGTLNGKVEFLQKDGLYKPEGLLEINDFEINKFKQGDLKLNIVGNNSLKKYDVNISLLRDEAKSIAAIGGLDFSSNTPTIDLEVFLEDFSLDAFSPLGQDVLSSLRGKASGNFTLKGFLGNPEMDGFLTLKDAGLKFPYLNADYDFEGDAVIGLQAQEFIIENTTLVDTKYNTKGKLSGNILHKDFDTWFLDLELETDNLLILDTQETEDSPYYGTGFIKGTAAIEGVTDKLNITVKGITQPNTLFVIPLKDVETVDSFDLIHFKSKETVVKDKQEEVAKEAFKGLSLDIELEVTKDAVAQVVIDKVYGSQLKGSGTGNLDIQINTNGKFDMFGTFNVDSGVYDFKLPGINKPFVIQKGGTISWDGSPFDANLDIVAFYKTKANPAVLLESFNTNRNIDIDLVTKITGGLFTSKQELDIQLPNVNPAIKSELDFVLNNNDVGEKNIQFMSLLALGSFVNPDKVNFDGNAAITGTASSAIAAAFSSLLNNPDSKLKLGVGYKQGRDNNDVASLNTDNQVDLNVSTKLGRNVIINGKVGVPVGSKTQSSVVGEVKVEVLLNDEGNFRAVIFNRQNEIQYSTEEEGYTQGVGLSYQVNFNSLSELLKKAGLKKKKKPAKKIKVLSKHKSLINQKKN